MRLLNPSPGELVDRLTVLNLKIGAAGAQNLPAQHLHDEYEQVSTALNTWAGECRNREEALRLWRGPDGLQHINARLWSLEDEVRALGEPSVLDVVDGHVGPITLRLAELAKLIARVNDHRSGVIRNINLQYGVQVVEYKIYKKS